MSGGAMPAIDDFGRPIDPDVLPEIEAAKGPPGLAERAKDTAVAHLYGGTIGSAIAAGQADPVNRTEQAIQGLDPEEQAIARQQLAEGLAEEARRMRGVENPVRVTPAQVAQIRNAMWPKASSAGEVAADVLGGLGGDIAGEPAMLVAPPLRVAEGLGAALPVARRALSGVAGRIIDSGAGAAVANTAVNPLVQENKVAAGLQPEFLTEEFATAPVVGFAGGAAFHGAGEALKYVGRGIARGFRETRARGALDTLQATDPAFVPPGTTPGAARGGDGAVSGAAGPDLAKPDATSVRAGEPAGLTERPSTDPDTLLGREQSEHALGPDVDKPGTDPREAYAEAMADVPPAVRDRYSAHGVSATQGGARADAVEGILRDRPEHLNRGPVLPTDDERATGVAATRTDAPYVLLYDNARPASDGPAFVVVNSRSAAAIDAAKARFPGVEVGSPTEIAARMQDGAGADGAPAGGLAAADGAGARTPAAEPSAAEDGVAPQGVSTASEPATRESTSDAPGKDEAPTKLPARVEADRGTLADHVEPATSREAPHQAAPLTAHQMLADLPSALRGGHVDTLRFSEAPRGEDLERLIAAGKAHEEGEVARVFGADAAEAKRLMRSTSDAAYDKLEALVAKYGPEAEAVVYGRRDLGPEHTGLVDTHDLEALRSALSHVDGAVDEFVRSGDVTDLGRELAWLAPKLPEPDAPLASHSTTQRTAVLQLARVAEDLRTEGVDPVPALKEALAYSLQRTHGDVGDAQLLLDRLAEYARRYMRPEPGAGGPRAAADAPRALPAPAGKEAVGRPALRTVERDGRPYVARADGSDSLGHITPEIGAAIGGEAGPIRLARGEHNDATGRGFGERHIEARHGKAIRAAGYPDAGAFVSDVAENFTQVRRGEGGRLLLVKGETPARVAVVELRRAGDGPEWSVTTAGLRSTRYLENAKRELLWEGGRRPAPGAGEGAPLERSGQSEAKVGAGRQAGKRVVRQAGGKPLTISQFIARNGGLPLDAEAKARDLGKAFVPGAGPLARKNGRSVDGFWREHLIEHGYLRPDADGGAQRDITKEIYDAVERERRGEKIYSEHDAPPAEPLDTLHQEIEAQASAIAKAHEEVGVRRQDLDPRTLTDAAELMWRGDEHDPLSAYERAAMMRVAADEHIGGTHEIYDVPPGWGDEVHGTAARADGEAARGAGRDPDGPGSEGGPRGPSEELPGAGEGGRRDGDAWDDDLSDLFRRRGRGGDASGGPDLLAREPEGGAKHAHLTSLQQQSLSLAKALGIPLRERRVGGRDALGVYRQRYGVARVREMGDFLTVAHEGGHGVEQMTPGVAELVRQHAAELGPLDYDATRMNPREGFAEVFALSLTNPAAAEMRAPGFMQAFRTLLADQHPRLLDALDRAAAEHARYLAAPSTERLATHVVDQHKSHWGHVREAFHVLRENGVPHTIGMVMSKTYDSFFDRQAPVDRAVRVLARAIQAQQGGGLVSIRPSEDPSKLIRLFGNAKDGALVMMRDGVIPYGQVAPVGPSLMDALSAATGQAKILAVWKGRGVEDFSSYLVARRASVLWDRYNAGKLEAPPVPFSKVDAERAMADFEAANPGFRDASGLVHQFTRNMLARQRDAGLISVDLHDQLAADPFYVPLFRDVSDRGPAAIGGRASSEGPGKTDTIQRLRGSTRDIIDPIQGIMMQTFLAERTIRHNDIVRGFASLAERAGASQAGLVEPVPAQELRATQVNIGDAIQAAARQRGMDPNDATLLMSSVTNAFGDDPILGTMFKMQPAARGGEPILFYKEAGQLKAVRLANNHEGLGLYETLSKLPQVMGDHWVKAINLSTKVLRYNTVVHPTFALTNYIKDQLAVGILRPDYIPFLSGLPGAWHELRQTEAAKLYAFMGGMAPGTAGSGLREAAKADVRQLARGSYAAAHLTNLEGLFELPQITEAMTRNSVFAKVYSQKLRQGLAPIDAAVEGAYQATDLLDFGRYGSHTLVMRAYSPFLNPHLQSLDKARRTMMEPLSRLARGDILTEDDQRAAANAGISLLKFALFGSILGAGHAALNWDHESYRDTTPEVKATNFIFPRGNGPALRMPKPYELSMGFTAGEYAYAKWVEHDPRAAGQFAEAMWEVLKTPDLILGNPIVRMAAEGATGRSVQTGRDIVPPAINRLDPQFQYTERTSGLARGVGNWSNGISDWLNANTPQGTAKMLGFDKP